MIRHGWIDAGNALAVVRQCELVGVSRATVYAQQKAKPVDESDLRLSRLIDEEYTCLLYTSDAADERSSVDLGGRRIIKKNKHTEGLCTTNQHDKNQKTTPHT